MDSTLVNVVTDPIVNMQPYQIIFNACVGGLIFPITQWLKNKIPNNWPINSVTMSYILSIAAAYGINAIFFKGMYSIDQVVMMGLAVTGTASQVAHSVKKTVDEYKIRINKNPGGTNSDHEDPLLVATRAIFTKEDRIGKGKNTDPLEK